MKHQRRRLTEPGALELIEEAVHLLRQARFSVWASYYLGSLPFILGLLYFWGDMSRDAAASQRLSEWPLILAAVFVWMKCWQTLYTRQLMVQLQQSDGLAWTWRRIRRLVITQAAVQPPGLFLLPLALILTIPFGWAYAFFENLTIQGDGREERIRQTSERAWQQSRLWPGQNHWLIWLLSPYLLMLVAVLLLVLVPGLKALAPTWSLGILWLAVSLISLLMLALCPLSVAVAVNCAATLILVPELAKMLLGVETQFTRSIWAMMNSTLLAAACGLTWLALDPLVKAVYVLRCFYGEARRSALDLRSELKTVRVKSAATLLFLLVITTAAVQAGSQNSLSSFPDQDAKTPSPGSTARETGHSAMAPHEVGSAPVVQLNQSIERVLASREYRWRLPREKRHTQGQEGRLVSILRDLTQTVRPWIRAFREWFERLFRRVQRNPGGAASGSSWLGSLRLLMIGAILILLLALGFLFWRRWRRRRVVEAVSEAVAALPDLTHEGATANQLSENGWLVLARELMGKGETRLALRALYLSSLAYLEHCQMLTIARYKSNLDYQRELERRAHTQPGLQAAFGENLTMFERVWYGFHEVNQELVALFDANLERIRSSAL